MTFNNALVSISILQNSAPAVVKLIVSGKGNAIYVPDSVARHQLHH
jgi:hypothetical protein